MAKIALIHDYLNQYGGAERVLEQLHQLYPEAPIYTSVYDRQGMQQLGFVDQGKDIRTSFMERLPLRSMLPRYYFTMFYPFAFQRFNLVGYDVILSDASYAAKYVRKPAGVKHVCYCHTPPRFLYGYDTDTSSKMNWLERQLSSWWKVYLKRIDQQRARDVDVWIANSRSIQEKIRQAYGVDSEIVYPPVDLQRFEGQPTIDQGYYFVVSRLGEYKRVDLIVEAFNQLGWPLKVVGRGPQAERLKSMAGTNVEILDALSDDQVTQMYLDCHALVLAAEEDAGITQLEAMACGKPVICLGRGGYVETVVDGTTGVFFAEQTVASLTDALERFSTMKFDPAVIRSRAAEFGPDRFQHQIAAIVDRVLKDEVASATPVQA